MEAAWGISYFMDQDENRQIRVGFALNSNFTDKIREWVDSDNPKIY